MSNAKRKELAGTGRGAVGKTAVVGAKDRATKQVRAQVVESTDKPTLQGFVVENTVPGARVGLRETAPCASHWNRFAALRWFATMPLLSGCH